MELQGAANVVTVDEQAFVTLANIAVTLEVRLHEEATRIGQHDLRLRVIILKAELWNPIDALNVDPVGG